ncbi:MAG: glucanotransferase [Actinomycetales bacterium]|nr:MAG: glucanotransferase [Actinomycetales bacterium]
MKNSNKTGLRSLLAIFICGLFLASCDGSNPDKEYGVFLGMERDDVLKLKDYATVVVDADYLSKDDVVALHNNGNAVVVSYLNIGSIEDFRDPDGKFGDIILGDYEDWPEEHWVDVSTKKWQDHVISKAKELTAKGIDGFFLDNADVYSQYKTAEIYDGLVHIIKKLDDLDKPLMINGGDIFVTKALADGFKKMIAGVNQETVFTSIDFDTKTFSAQETETKDYYQKYLQSCKAAGLQVFILEYGSDAELKKKSAAYCKKNGFHCTFSASLELEKE